MLVGIAVYWGENVVKNSSKWEQPGHQEASQSGLCSGGFRMRSLTGSDLTAVPIWNTLKTCELKTPDAAGVDSWWAHCRVTVTGGSATAGVDHVEGSPSPGCWSRFGA